MTTEKNKPSVENDLSFVGHIDVQTNENFEKKDDKIINKASELAEGINETEDPKDSFQINLSKKITKRNGTMYLAVFSVPLPNPNDPTGKFSIALS